MAESAQYINSLVETSPTGDDYKYDGAAHMRVVKSAVKNTFPNINGAVTAIDEELNTLSGVSSNVQSQLGSLSGQITTLFNSKSTLSSTLEATYNTTSASLSTMFATLSSTLETRYSSASSGLNTRFSDLESKVAAPVASFSSINTYFTSGRDVGPKHWATAYLQSATVAVATFDASRKLIFPISNTTESTVSIIDHINSALDVSGSASSYFFLTAVSTPYFTFKTPSGVSKARITARISSIPYAGVYPLQAICIYNNHKKSIYIQNYSLQMVDDATRYKDVVYSGKTLMIGAYTGNYVVGHYRSIELSVSVNSRLFVGIEGDYTSDPNGVIEGGGNNGSWIGVEYR